MTTHTRDTKECVMCYEHIDSRARKCPHCSALQSKWANVEGNPWLVAVLAVFIVGIFGNLLFSVLWRPKFEDYSSQLVVNIARHDFKELDGKATVSCLGSINNTSKYDWSDFRFTARLYGADGGLIDTFSTSDNALLVPSGRQANFRLQGPAALREQEYRKCDLQIMRAVVVQ